MFSHPGWQDGTICGALGVDRQNNDHDNQHPAYMMIYDCQNVTKMFRSICRPGCGILAADETPLAMEDRSKHCYSIHMILNDMNTHHINIMIIDNITYFFS